MGPCSLKGYARAAKLLRRSRVAASKISLTNVRTLDSAYEAVVAVRNARMGGAITNLTRLLVEEARSLVVFIRYVNQPEAISTDDPLPNSGSHSR